jgi:uncharacterized protein YigA (DUF484 family)
MAKDKSPFSRQDVVAYITAHPDCLAQHPELLAQCLAAAKSVDADTDPGQLSTGQFNPDMVNPDMANIVDLSPALAARARDEARRLGLAHKSLLHVAAENMVSWKRLHHATLALLASTDLAGLCHVISAEFPTIFDLQKSLLIIESETSLAGIVAAGLDVQPAARITTALQGRTIYLGAPNDAGTTLLGQPAASIALIRLPDRLPAPVSNCVLLLAGNHPTSFQPDLGSDLLVLLAEMIGVTLAARLESLVELR